MINHSSLQVCLLLPIFGAGCLKTGRSRCYSAAAAAAAAASQACTAAVRKSSARHIPIHCAFEINVLPQAIAR